MRSRRVCSWRCSSLEVQASPTSCGRAGEREMGPPGARTWCLHPTLGLRLEALELRLGRVGGPGRLLLLRLGVVHVLLRGVDLLLDVVDRLVRRTEISGDLLERRFALIAGTRRLERRSGGRLLRFVGVGLCSPDRKPDDRDVGRAWRTG